MASKETKAPYIDGMTKTVFTFAREEDAEPKLQRVVSNIVAQCKASASRFTVRKLCHSYTTLHSTEASLQLQVMELTGTTGSSAALAEHPR